MKNVRLNHCDPCCAAIGLAAILCALLGCRTAPGLSPLLAIPPGLIGELRFEDKILRGPVPPALARQMMNVPLVTGDQVPEYEFLARNGPDGQPEYLRTETVAKYLAAGEAGAAGATTYDDAAASWFQDAADMLTFLESSVPARIDLLGGSPLPDISVSFLDWAGDKERRQREKDAAAGVTLRDYKRRGEIVHLRATGEAEIRFDSKNKEYCINWLAVGDADGDGFQDGLISVGAYYRGGSGRNYTSYRISRTNASQRSISVQPHAALLDQRVSIFPHELP